MVGKLRKKNISSQSELIELVNHEWKEISQEQIDNWIDSMPGRIIEWIDQDGDRIKYSFYIHFSLQNSHFLLQKFSFFMSIPVRKKSKFQSIMKFLRISIIYYK